MSHQPRNAKEERTRSRIESEIESTRDQITRLRATYADIVSSSEYSPPDDEHDPEGNTVAFERAQVQAMIEALVRHVEELNAALRRIADDSYGLCEVCGRTITPERLDARPASARCIPCLS